MESLKMLAQNTEIKSRIENEGMCKTIVNHLEKMIGSKFSLDLPDGGKLSYLNVITTILMVPSYDQYRGLLLKMLDYSDINEKGLLIHLLGVINQIRIGISKDAEMFTRTQFLNSFMQLPYIKDFKADDKKMEFDTKYGHIKLFSYDKITDNTKIYNIMRNNTLSQKCHSVVEYFKDEFKDDYIVTSEIPFLFKGNMYHSYFLTNEGVVDLANNIFYPEGVFESLITKEIFKIKCSEFDKVFQKTMEEKINDDGKLAPVLALALNNKRKN